MNGKLAKSEEENGYFDKDWISRHAAISARGDKDKLPFYHY